MFIFRKYNQIRRDSLLPPTLKHFETANICKFFSTKDDEHTLDVGDPDNRFVCQSEKRMKSKLFCLDFSGSSSSRRLGGSTHKTQWPTPSQRYHPKIHPILAGVPYFFSMLDIKLYIIF